MGDRSHLTPALLCLLSLASFASGVVPPTLVAAPLFEDVTEEAGLDFRHVNGMSGRLYFVETMGAGGGLADLDGDGDLDLYLVQGHLLPRDLDPAASTLPLPGPPPFRDRIFRTDLAAEESSSRPAIRLVDVTDSSGVEGFDYGMGVAAGDVDGDGDVDLYVTAFGPNRLWVNRGDLTFEDRTEEAGVGEGRWSVPASLADLDGDGRLDLAVGNYVAYTLAGDRRCPDFSGRRAGGDYCGAQTYPAERDRLWLNRGDGVFEDVTAPSGLSAAVGRALGTIVIDPDADGRLDLYVANDATANHLWMNRGGGSFSEDAVLGGVAVNIDGAAEGGMGVDAGDFDGDGGDDLFVAHLTRETNTLYRNGGGGLFRDDTIAAGLGTASWEATGFGAAFVDANRDGWLDIAVVNGAVEIVDELFEAGDPHPLRQPDDLYLNRAGSGFALASDGTGIRSSTPEASRGLAPGDVDGDGATDLLVTANGGPARLLRGTPPPSSWIGIRLVTPGGGDDLGSSVEVVTEDGRRLRRRSRTDGSYASARDPRIVVGLGAGGAASRLRVEWLGGGRVELREPPEDRYLVVRRPEPEEESSR